MSIVTLSRLRPLSQRTAGMSGELGRQLHRSGSIEIPAETPEKEQTMYRKILVLLDGSTRAETILSHVKHLAKLGNSTVVLLQVVEPTPTFATSYELTSHSYSADLAKQWTLEAQKYLEGVQDDHQPVVEIVLEGLQD